MNKRRSLTPSTGMPTAPEGTHAMRRGGARQTVSDRVTFRGGSGEREGWALNVSRGGLRAILDDDTDGKVELGEEYEIVIGDAGGAEPKPSKRGRIVWLQEEPDGFVVGIEYIGVADASGENPTTDGVRVETTTSSRQTRGTRGTRGTPETD